ncbi:MAG: hypothetical protein LBG43_07025 [Treponema sp.]|jgi:hypothetical protein|nr:hypothetical protein [Treponema sp.]
MDALFGPGNLFADDPAGGEQDADFFERGGDRNLIEIMNNNRAFSKTRLVLEKALEKAA